MHVTVEDAHFIFGPNMTNISSESEFEPANSAYDTQNQANNIVRMLKKCRAKDEAASSESDRQQEQQRSDRLLKRE